MLFVLLQLLTIHLDESDVFSAWVSSIRDLGINPPSEWEDCKSKICYFIPSVELFMNYFLPGIFYGCNIFSFHFPFEFFSNFFSLLTKPKHQNIPSTEFYHCYLAQILYKQVKLSCKFFF